ncbi:MAG: hypothetical protein O3C52_00030 [Proteobacteria bacterium]|jgi:hypothetical protein|nr:hypothetical protein [Pseudomonadota bacterium]MDA0915437.1 hypothetical protein [Pseudomonadota bacterium]MDA1031759.1 hypothetical protein [Pseudomonadota bacterium]NBS22417.1 hypothetical protein [Altererythrobacter sp.]
MEQAELKVEHLPAEPLDAAAAFHRAHLNSAIAALEGAAADLTIILPLAPSNHDDWRRTVARDLARKFAPKRVNVLGGGSEAAVQSMLAYLRGAPGVTGQYLPLHD